MFALTNPFIIHSYITLQINLFFISSSIKLFICSQDNWIRSEHPNEELHGAGRSRIVRGGSWEDGGVREGLVGGVTEGKYVNFTNKKDEIKLSRREDEMISNVWEQREGGGREDGRGGGRGDVGGGGMRDGRGDVGGGGMRDGRGDVGGGGMRDGRGDVGGGGMRDGRGDVGGGGMRDGGEMSIGEVRADIKWSTFPSASLRTIDPSESGVSLPTHCSSWHQLPPPDSSGWYEPITSSQRKTLNSPAVSFPSFQDGDHFQKYDIFPESIKIAQTIYDGNLRTNGNESTRTGNELNRTEIEPTRTGIEPTRTGNEPIRTGNEPTRTGNEPARTGNLCSTGNICHPSKQDKSGEGITIGTINRRSDVRPLEVTIPPTRMTSSFVSSYDGNDSVTSPCSNHSSCEEKSYWNRSPSTDHPGWGSRDDPRVGGRGSPSVDAADPDRMYLYDEGEVVSVVVNKGPIGGIGFSIEGGRGSLTGDRPIFIKRLFKGSNYFLIFNFCHIIYLKYLSHQLRSYLPKSFWISTEPMLHASQRHNCFYLHNGIIL